MFLDYKAIILCGAPGVGKGILQNFIAEGHNPDNVVHLNGRNKKEIMSDKFIFRSVTEKTTLIIVDDVESLHIFNLFMPLVEKDGVIIARRQCKADQVIKTKGIQFVFSTTFKAKRLKTSYSLNKRFHIIKIG